MPSNLFISDQAASTCIDKIGKQLDQGFLDVYAGTQPADANTNTTASEYILAQYNFAFNAGTAVGSTWTANAINSTIASSTGIATFYACYSSGHALIMYGSVSTSGADFNLNTNNIIQGIHLSIT